MEMKDLLIKREKSKEKDDPTDLLIREHFLKLLTAKPIEKITVSELCQICAINRSTFYRHYEDLYQLMDAVTRDAHAALFYDVISEVDPGEELSDAIYRYILKVCEKTLENKSLYRLLLFGKTQTGLRELMENSAFNLYLMAHEGPSNFRSGSDAYLHYQYLVKGMIGVWSMWVKDQFTPDKEVIAQVIREEMVSFYETMGRLYGKNS